MPAFDKLIEIFRTFPGIGPRQAKRFAYHLIQTKRSFNADLANAVLAIKNEVLECTSCHRFFTGVNPVCDICSNTKRDQSLLMVVAYDSDLESIEKSKGFEGLYFVLGGLIPLIEKEIPIRTKELVETIQKRSKNLTEIIIALSVTAEGDHTSDELKRMITPLTTGTPIKITTLGRGVSTGSELEYADSETLNNALQGRK